ncbi:HNH endonuclease [Flavobacterium sp. RHBU_24]|uniref:HNH endonuclease n=1 Tax=Flavobacterium sp. RHBU_24 TaxID=3391185 RepID=UPI003984E695
MSFREADKIPARRNIITAVASYSAHRPDLIIDFKQRCGYCNDIHIYRIASFEIDHFIPRIRKKKPFLSIKTDTDYSNLVYSCKSCNNAKRNKWPTDDENIPNRDDKGFIDPCDIEYDSQFIRLPNGQIRAVTKLGDWIYKELRLDKPQHEIIYNLEQLDFIIDQLEPNLNKLEDIALYKRITNLLLKYRAYVKQLGTV